MHGRSGTAGTLDQGAERRHGLLMPPLRFPLRFLATPHRFFMPLFPCRVPLLRFPLRFLATPHRFRMPLLPCRVPLLRFPLRFLATLHRFRMPLLRFPLRFPMPPIRSPLQFRIPPILLPAPKVELPVTFPGCPLHLSQTAPDKQALSKPNDQGSRRAENLPYLHRFEHDHDVGCFPRRESLLYHTFTKFNRTHRSPSRLKLKNRSCPTTTWSWTRTPSTSATCLRR